MADGDVAVQKKWTLDKVTLIKTLKGAGWAIFPAAAIAGLEWLGQLKISNTYLAAFIVWFVPSAINWVREWKKGG